MIRLDNDGHDELENRAVDAAFDMLPLDAVRIASLILVLVCEVDEVPAIPDAAEARRIATAMRLAMHEEEASIAREKIARLTQKQPSEARVEAPERAAAEEET